MRHHRGMRLTPGPRLAWSAAGPAYALIALALGLPAFSGKGTTVSGLLPLASPAGVAL